MRRLFTLLLIILLLAALAVPVTAQTPTTTEELLSGMVTEEVEPGVFRVENRDKRPLPIGSRIVSGHDGSIWFVGEESFLRFGSDSPRRFPKGWDTRLEVAADGTVWTSTTRRGRTAASEITRTFLLDDGSWRRRLKAPAYGNGQGLHIAPDGTLWAAYPLGDADESGGVVVTRLGPDGWEPLPEPAPDTDRLVGDLVVTRSGEVWLGGQLGRFLVPDDNGGWQESEIGSLWRYREDDDGWQEVTVDALVTGPFGSSVEIGADGTVWFAGVEPLMVDGEPVPDDAVAWSPKPGDPFLMRFDDTDWQRWGPTDGVPTLGIGWGLVLRQAPDGGLWMAQAQPETPCSEHWGVVRFDGSTWHDHLTGQCVSAMDVTPDGSVWLMATSDNSHGQRYDLYVITPEAVGGAE